MAGKTGFDKLAERLDRDSKIRVGDSGIAPPAAAGRAETKAGETAEGRDGLYQWTVLMPMPYKKLLRELKYVTEKSYRELAIEGLEALRDKYLAGK